MDWVMCICLSPFFILAGIGVFNILYDFVDRFGGINSCQNV